MRTVVCWIGSALTLVLFGALGVYFSVMLSPFLLLFVLVGLFVTLPYWLLQPVTSFRWVKNELRKNFRSTPEEEALRLQQDAIRRRADELAQWEARGELDAKTKPASEGQSPHHPACRCDLCKAYWRGWAAGL